MNDKIKKIIYSIHPLEKKLLPFLLILKSVEEISKKSNLSEVEINTGLQLLEEKNYLEIDKKEEIYVELDKLGMNYVNSELPEIKFLKEILEKGKKKSELSLSEEEIVTSLGILKRNNLIDIKNENGMFFSAKSGAKEFIEKSINPLKLFKEIKLKEKLNKEEKEAFEELKKRKGFIKEVSKKSFSFKLTKDGEVIAKEIQKNYLNLELLEAVDSDILKSGSWKNKEFRHYDVSVSASLSEIGRRHPMLEANNILRDVFVEMGFKEMSGPMIESAFWNMDTMWIPQDHPAREDMDTFYLDKEATVPTDLVKKVKEMHEKGIKRTHTMENEWSEDITKRRLLRTHSTATTFRTLAKLAQDQKKGKDINGKYFYVANVFRNETVDATHLAEFYQAEGFIVGDDLSLADLMGFIKEYYAKLGITQIKFKPTYNPYTEPSMEAHYYDPLQKKWYSLINSGIFRQETLEPLGLKNKSIIAWGMGASRVAALLAGKTSMRDITGATCDFNWLKNRPIMTRRIIR